MNTNFQVDTENAIRYSLSVDTSREYVGSLKSPVSSTGRWCPQHFCQHGAGAFRKPIPPSVGAGSPPTASRLLSLLTLFVPWALLSMGYFPRVIHA